jgi:hypothetical protein
MNDKNTSLQVKLSSVNCSKTNMVVEQPRDTHQNNTKQNGNQQIGNYDNKTQQSDTHKNMLNAILLSVVLLNDLTLMKRHFDRRQLETGPTHQLQLLLGFRKCVIQQKTELKQNVKFELKAVFNFLAKIDQKSTLTKMGTIKSLGSV